MAVELAPHQINALKEMKNGSVLRGGVGTGKSRVSLAYYILKETRGQTKINGIGGYAPMESPKDLYIITTAKKRDSLDWEKEAAVFGITQKGPSRDGVQLHVDSWNNIINYTEVKDAFFIFDEQRLVGRGAWVKAFIKIAKQNNWILLSATPGDTWMDYIPVFIAHGHYKNRTEFLRRHVVFNQFSRYPKVDRYLERNVLERLRKSILVEMPYARHTIRNVRNVVVEYDLRKYERAVKERWHVYEDRPIKDVGELFRVIRKIVNEDTSRLAAVMELHEKHPRLIVFYNFNYELEALRVLCNTLGVSHAEWNGHKHQEIPETDKWIYLVQYTAGAEGWNCIATNAIAFYSLTYSYKIYEQSMGRIDRINTPFKDLWYYVIRSMAPIDQAIVKSITTKKNFNEKEFAGDWEQRAA